MDEFVKLVAQESILTKMIKEKIFLYKIVEITEDSATVGCIQF